MANLAAVRSAIRASRAALTASRAVRRAMPAGLSASDPARAARSSWAFFASAAALRRSPNPVFLDLSISTYSLVGEAASGPKGRWFQIGVCRAIFQGMDETKLEKLAHRSGRVASKVIDALERGGVDTRGKLSAPIGKIPRPAPFPKPKATAARIEIVR